MFNLKRFIPKAKAAFKSEQQLIAEIHNSFDSASERLLNEAKAILSAPHNIEKGERLKAIGFTSAQKAVESDKIKNERQEKESLAKQIEYYQTFYPQNKFITKKEVEAICKKYGIVFAEARYYTADIPEKNLAEIEAFKLREEDCIVHKNDWYEYIGNGCYNYSQPNGIGSYYGHVSGKYTFKNRPINEKYYHEKPEYFICAPRKDFSEQLRLSSDGYTLIQKDPIVLQPVNGGYLVVSKWGLEGKDEMVLNEKMN